MQLQQRHQAQLAGVAVLGCMVWHAEVITCIEEVLCSLCWDVARNTVFSFSHESEGQIMRVSRDPSFFCSLAAPWIYCVCH